VPEQPDFFVLAGPNGAGKSTNANSFMPAFISVFNGDLFLQQLEGRYPHIESSRLAGGVAVELEKQRDQALSNNQSFGFETNYSSDMSTEITHIFKNAKYRTNLIYFGLDDINESIARVNEREKDGGHHVPEEIIKYNFKEGIIRVNKDLGLYNTILFAETKATGTSLVAFINNSSKVKIILNKPMWFVKHFKSNFEKISLQD
jgi:predicted ABC-type ATPase